jgi:hypothetical protein
VEVPGGYGQAGTHLQIEIDVIVRLSGWTQAVQQRLVNMTQELHRLGDGAELAGSPGGNPIQPRPRWRVSVPQLATVFDAMAATLTAKDVVGPLEDLARIDPVAIPQLRVLRLVTGRPVSDVLETTGLRQIPDAGTSHRTHMLADPALDLADIDERREQVGAWLVQQAPDAGMLGMEQVLERITPVGS